jgi:hypothetical protein
MAPMHSEALDNAYTHHLTFNMTIFEINKSMDCAIVCPRAIFNFRFEVVNQNAPNGGWELPRSLLKK